MAESRDFSKPRRNLASGSGYSLFVKLAKFSLPIFALVIVGIVIARLTQNPLQAVDNAPKNPTDTPTGMSELLKAQYEGVDAEGRAYTLIADRARRDPATPDSILLDNIRADMTMEDQSWVAVTAKNGVYGTKTEMLNLTGGVEVFHDSGYSMKMASADVDIKARHAVSKVPVEGQGPLGTLTGQNMEITDSGNRIIFGGPAKLTLYHVGEKG